MTVIDGVDLALMRDSIGNLFDLIPELNVIQRYADAADVGDIPSAEIWLMNINRDEGEEQLGYNAYKAQWRINVRLAPAGAGAQRQAQENFELLVLRFHHTFDPMTLIRAVPVITNASFDGANIATHPLSDGTLYAEFRCSTTFLALQPS